MMYLKPTNGTHQPFPAKYAAPLTDGTCKSPAALDPVNQSSQMVDRDLKNHGAPWAYALNLAAIRRANENKNTEGLL